LIAVLGVAGASLFSKVNAQYVGHNSSKFTDLAVLIESGNDDDYVQLEGKLLSKVGNEKYIFSDGKQEIRVEIDSEDFPREQFDENAIIRIEGEFEKDFMESPEIDVDRLTIVKR
jgi:uncharacterized protein (TIGR00156 family)